jgi:PPOX class probable F420-dependent enzyme
MTDFPSSHSDLLDAETATLATIDDDGLPQLTQVWFIHDGGELRLSLNGERFKTANLKARGACSLLILDVSNPYRYLEVRGTARASRRMVARSRARSARSTTPTWPHTTGRTTCATP